MLCIKAKLESIESGIETWEQAFLAHIQMANGRSVGEFVLAAIADGNVPLMLPPGGNGGAK